MPTFTVLILPNIVGNKYQTQSRQLNTDWLWKICFTKSSGRCQNIVKTTTHKILRWIQRLCMENRSLKTKNLFYHCFHTNRFSKLEVNVAEENWSTVSTIWEFWRKMILQLMCQWRFGHKICHRNCIFSGCLHSNLVWCRTIGPLILGYLCQQKS